MSHRTVNTRAPSASIVSRPAARCSSLRLAITIAAPSRANSVAMALPKPVPPPVTSTPTPSNVPEGSADAPTGGGSGKPINSVTVSPFFRRARPSAARVPRRTIFAARGAQLRDVVALVDERLVDHLVGHRRSNRRDRKMSDDLPGHLHGDRRDGSNVLGDLPNGRIERVLRYDTAHDAVRECLVGC